MATIPCTWYVDLYDDHGKHVGNRECGRPTHTGSLEEHKIMHGDRVDVTDGDDDGDRPRRRPGETVIEWTGRALGERRDV